MEKFLLIIREDLKKLKEYNEERRHLGIRHMMSWLESLSESGNYRGGEPLLTTGKYVSRDLILSDGPFVEAKEAISGYLVMEAETLEQAASFAQTCPLVQQGDMVIEVRPIMTVNSALLDGRNPA